MKRTMLHCASALLLLLSTYGFSEQSLTPAKDSGSIESTTYGQGGLSARVDLDADDAFLPAILRTLSEVSGYNIVTGPEVNRQQRISIHISNTPVEEAINLVVRATGLSYEIVGNSFLVTAPENLKNEVGISSYLIELQYAKAAEVKQFLKDLTANIQVVESNNALLISTSPKIISEIRQIVQKLDVPSKQIVLQTRVIEVQVDKIKEMGIDWEKLSKLTTIIAERPVDFATGVGIDSKDFIGDTKLGELPSDHTFQMIDGLKNVGKFDRQLTAFDITLDFLLKTNNAKLLTDTKLATMNNRKASIHIGEIIPFIVQSEEAAHVEREKIGISVEITPQINKDSLITATVKPEASTIVELINGTIPRKKIRTAETTVLVKDKQKIIIAGLLSTEDAMDVHSVPFLGDIPYAGKLFKHYNQKQITTDLIIEITPYILNNNVEEAQALQDSLFGKENPIEKYMAEELKRKNEGFVREQPEPTHLALMPTAKTLKKGQYVIGLREISFGYNDKIMISVSPWYTIGRTQASLKYALSPSAAVGLGFNKGMYIGDDKFDSTARFAMYAVNSFVDTKAFSLHTAVSGQLGYQKSVGASIGISVGPKDKICLITDFSHNYTPDQEGTTERWDPWLTSALRVTIPTKNRLILEGGVSCTGSDTFSKPFSEYGEDYTFKAYANIAVAGFFKENK